MSWCYTHWKQYIKANMKKNAHTVTCKSKVIKTIMGSMNLLLNIAEKEPSSYIYFCFSKLNLIWLQAMVGEFTMSPMAPLATFWFAMCWSLSQSGVEELYSSPAHSLDQRGLLDSSHSQGNLMLHDNRWDIFSAAPVLPPCRASEKVRCKLPPECQS